jgi:hypothetical protein
MNPANTNRDRIAYGSKYERDLDVVEIAKRVRKELKAELPKGTKCSVRIDRFSGGQSISLKVDAVPFPIVNPEYVCREVLEPHTYHQDAIGRWTPEAVALLAQADAILSAYNFDGSDSQTDYYHVNFYGHADFGDQEHTEWVALRAKFEGALAAEKAALSAYKATHAAALPDLDDDTRNPFGDDARHDACPAAAWHEPGTGCDICH